MSVLVHRHRPRQIPAVVRSWGYQNVVSIFLDQSSPRANQFEVQGKATEGKINYKKIASSVSGRGSWVRGHLDLYTFPCDSPSNSPGSWGIDPSQAGSV